jgi:hypothetical protein
MIGNLSVMRSDQLRHLGISGDTFASKINLNLNAFMEIVRQK